MSCICLSHAKNALCFDSLQHSLERVIDVEQLRLYFAIQDVALERFRLTFRDWIAKRL